MRLKALPLQILRTALSVTITLLAAISALLLVASRHRQRFPEYVTSIVASDAQFERISEPGFDDQGRQRLADSAWSMRYFQADGADQGYIYVGTDNNIIGLGLSVLKGSKTSPPVEPPQIRRYRPDLGPETWEVVFDYADHEQPPYLNEGFRTMVAYRALSDGVNYLYVGTMADHRPTVWRSATGDLGSWELVFTFPLDAAHIGSVRGMQVHDDGLLYMSTTPRGDILPGGIGQIWVTDGETFTRVISDGFGNIENSGITKLGSFDGCLYAGTYNAHTGYELWKLRCMSAPDAAPTMVIGGGGGHRYNESILSMHNFQGHLYFGTGIPLGFNPRTRHGPRGCELLRLDAQDNVELIVGPEEDNPLSGYGPGFGWYLNSYCWYMQDDGENLYMGTWDMSRTIAWLGTDIENVAIPFRPLLVELIANPADWGSPVGADLYRSANGIDWQPLTLDGFGNPDNHGIRTMQATEAGMVIGTENPFTRLEVWLLPTGQ